MKCRSCPYGIEYFNGRMNLHEKTVYKHGAPNDIYGYLEPEDAADKFEQFLWCDKVGGNVYCFGHCEDAYGVSKIIKQKNRSKKKRRNKRERDQKQKTYIKYLARTYPCYPPPAMPVDENGHWNFDDPIGTIYYRRTYRGSHKGNRYTYYKKYANRCVRRYKGEIHNGNMYRKIFDYWWTVN